MLHSITEALNMTEDPISSERGECQICGERVAKLAKHMRKFHEGIVVEGADETDKADTGNRKRPRPALKKTKSYNPLALDAAGQTLHNCKECDTNFNTDEDLDAHKVIYHP